MNETVSILSEIAKVLVAIVCGGAFAGIGCGLLVGEIVRLVRGERSSLFVTAVAIAFLLVAARLAVWLWMLTV